MTAQHNWVADHWAADPALRPWDQDHPDADGRGAHLSPVHAVGPGEAPDDAAGDAAFGGARAASTDHRSRTGASSSWASNPSLMPWLDHTVRAPEPVTAAATPSPAAPSPAVPEVIPHENHDRAGETQRPGEHGLAEDAATAAISAPPRVAPGGDAAPVDSLGPMPHPSPVATSATAPSPHSPASGPVEDPSPASALWVPPARRRRTAPVPGPGPAFDAVVTDTGGEQAPGRGPGSVPDRPAAAEPETRAAAPAPIPAPSTQRRHTPPGTAPAVAAAVPGDGRARPARVTPAAPALVDGLAPRTRTVVQSGPVGVVTASVEPLTEEGMVRRRGEESGTGWRRALFRASGGAVRVPAGVAQRRRDGWITRIRTDLPSWHTVTVASIKGGIGKTTLAALVGLALAEYRGDRVVALDANPDAGTLADRLLGGPALRTVRDLIAELDAVDTSTEMARYTAMAHRLHVLASDQDPAMSEAFSKGEYDQVLRLLKRFYNIIITDSGTGLIHSAMGGALESTRTLVIAGAPTVDGGSRASKTLDWLHAHGFDELAADAVVVLSQDRSSREVDREAIAEHFRRRCRAVVDLPLDPHLMTGGQIVFDRLRSRTRDAALEIAAHVGDQFGWDWPEQHTVPTRGLQHAAPRHPDGG